ncbi:MAG TPA: hypothetical protein PLJ60_11450 [Chryseolinea sp.]|nr:hypothetical protein [Chryseolinea sp.]
MKQLISALFLVSIYNCGFSQQDFLFESRSLDELRAYEKSINSEYLGFVKTQVATDYFPTAKEKYDYYPLCFKRTNDDFFPQLGIEYFYDENDSILLATSYDWNIMNYVKNLKTDGDKFEVEKKRKKQYLKKYNDIKQGLIKKYGEPKTVEETKSGDGYFYRLRWENESNKILVLLKFSTKLKVLPGNMKFGSYDIRVKIDYIK